MPFRSRGVAFLALAACALAPARADDASRRLYRAALAAADGALRLHDANAARRWLEEAPADERGWEWRLLAARADASATSVAAHAAPATSVDVSPDGTLVATASADRTARLFRADGLAPIRSFEGHGATVWTARFSPDGKTLATACSDGVVRLFDVASGELRLRLEGVGSGIAAADFSPDGEVVAAASWKRSPERGVWGVVTFWSAATGDLLRTIEHGIKPIVALDWSPDGDRVAVGTWDADVAIFRRGDGALLARLQPEENDAYQAVQSVAWSADGRTLAVGAKDGTARIWAAVGETAGELLRTQAGQAEGQRRWVNGLAALPDGRLLQAQGDGTLRLFDDTGTERAAWHGHDGPVTAVALAPGARAAFTVGRDGTLRSWDLAHLAAERTAWKLPASAYSLAWSRDGRSLALTGWTGFVEIRDAATGDVVSAWHGHEASGVALDASSDGMRLATTGNDETVKLWDARTGALVATLAQNLGRQPLAVAFRPGAEEVAAPTRGGAIARWSSRDGRPLVGWDDEGRTIATIAWSPDGRRLAAASADGRVTIDEADRPGVRRTLELGANPVALAFSPDGSELAVGAGDGTLRRIDLRTEAASAPPVALAAHEGAVQAVRFSPDGRRIATGGSADDRVRIFNAATGDALLALPFDAAIWNLAWSPDGGTLAVLPLDGTLRLVESK